MRSLLLAALLLTSSFSVRAQSAGVLGTWQTPSRDVIQIQPCGSSICARILALRPDAASHFDIHNPNAAQRTRPLCHLQIGWGFHPVDPGHAEDGHLYDPKAGRTYSGIMSADGNTLHLRGYIGTKLFGRTETWTRLPAAAPVPPCT